MKKRTSKELDPHTLTRPVRAPKNNPFMQTLGRSFAYGASFAFGMFCIIWVIETLGF